MSGINVAGVLPHPVHAGYEAHILDGTGLQKGIPGIYPLLRPAGDVQDEVVIRLAVDHLVTGENGETEVITNLKQDAETRMLHHDPLLTGRVAFVLAGISEQVVLVIIYIMSVREYEIEPATAQSLFRA